MDKRFTITSRKHSRCKLLTLHTWVTLSANKTFKVAKLKIYSGTVIVQRTKVKKHFFVWRGEKLTLSVWSQEMANQKLFYCIRNKSKKLSFACYHRKFRRSDQLQLNLGKTTKRPGIRDNKCKPWNTNHMRPLDIGYISISPSGAQLYLQHPKRPKNSGTTWWRKLQFLNSGYPTLQSNQHRSQSKLDLHFYGLSIFNCFDRLEVTQDFGMMIQFQSQHCSWGFKESST